MRQKNVKSDCRTTLRRLAFAALALVILTGCSGSFLAGNKEDPSNYIWKHRDQYVRVEKQDRLTDTTPPNDHPVTIPAQQIENILGSLDAEYVEKGKLLPIFTSKEVVILSEAISTGLATAKTREDVTFAIAGVHRDFISFNSDRQYVTGRVFFVDGKLNLIIGDLHKPYIDNVERRLYPLEPGTRMYKAPDPRKPAPVAWKPVPMAGLETPTIAGVERPDWMVLNTDPQLWKTAVAQKKEAKETAKEAFREASEVRETSAQLEAEQQQLRSEIQEMKQTIEQMKQAPPAAAPTAAPSVAPAAPVSGDMKKIEDRLEILQRIREKGWITEQEYQAKKKEILDSF
ncbi:MAG: SHOCT domain-containing protein [Syntrophotaleaceae bacterium]